MSRLWELSSQEIYSGIKTGELSAEEYVISLLERIKQLDPKINSYVSIAEKESLKYARNIDKKVKAKEEVGKLCGMAMAVKDCICTRGIRTTCSSLMLENYVPPYDATVVERIRREDAIIVGKTNMDEFSMGSSTEHSHFGPTRNPWDPKRVPGGSSGGSATAIAANEATLALGVDTGGSIRCPASFCSVVGLKPTYGLVSRYGLISYANSLEQIGPLTRNVYDCALLLSVIAGHDRNDSTSVKKPSEDYTKYLIDDVTKMRIGVPKEFFALGTQEMVSKSVWESIHKLEMLGAVREQLSLRNLEYALSAYYIIAMSEASSNLARYDGLRYGYRVPDKARDFSTVFSKNRDLGFGLEVKRRIILGTFALSAGYFDQYYLKAQKIRTLIKEDFDRAFKEYDVLIGPTMPILPFEIGEKIQDPIRMYMCDIDTVPINLAGLPAISVPCGFYNNLPIGMQIIAPPFREDLLLRVAFSFEQNFPQAIKVKL